MNKMCARVRAYLRAAGVAVSDWFFSRVALLAAQIFWLD